MSSTKLFPASKKKLAQARKDGDVLKSNLLSSAFALFAALIALTYFSKPLARLEKIFDLSLKLVVSSSSPQAERPKTLIFEISSNLFELVLFPLFLAGIFGFFVEMSQTRALLSFKSIFRLGSLLKMEAFRQKWSITDKNTEDFFASGVLRESLRNTGGFLLLCALS